MMPTKDPERIRANRRRYYERHREAIIAKTLKRYRRNPRKWKARGRRWRDANKERVRAYDKKYRMEKKMRMLSGLPLPEIKSEKASEVAAKLLAKAEAKAKQAKYGIQQVGNYNP